MDRSGFVVSFSVLGDDNSLWERYATPAGVAIAWPSSGYPNVFDPTGSYQSPWDDSRGGIAPLSWTRMIYSVRRQAVAIRTALEEALAQARLGIVDMFDAHADERAVVTLTEAIVSIKQAGFRSEQEWRYIVGCPWDTRLIGDSPHGRTYVELTGDQSASWPALDYSDIHVSRLPIKAVRLGPALRERVGEVSELIWAKYPGVQVLPSASTLRVH